MKGKWHWKSYLVGVLTIVLVLMLAIPVLGASGTLQTWYDVLVGGITIVMDGDVIEPKDANGNPVDPVIYNGTTYLPVRAIAAAVGKAVDWDGRTKTVYLGWKPSTEFSWVMTKKSFEATPTPVKQTVYTYSCDGIHDNVVWFMENYRWSSGSEYVNADGYWGCQLPPASIPSSGKVTLTLGMQVKDFEGNASVKNMYAPFDGCYVTTSYGRFKDENGNEYLDPDPNTAYVLGNLEMEGVFTAYMPESASIGAECEIRFYCPAGYYVWTYTLQKN